MKKYKISCKQGETLLSSLRRSGIYVTAPCGGNGTCGKCTVKIRGAECLACKTVTNEEELEVEVTPEGENFAVDYEKIDKIETQPRNFSDKANSMKNNLTRDENRERLYAVSATGETKFELNRYNSQFGIAIDIGTTTLAFELMDMQTGKRIAAHTRANSQRVFGADIISRINCAVEGDALLLNVYIMEDIQKGIAAVLLQGKVEKNEIFRIAIAGNTAMLYLLQNFPCNSLGVYPFTPVSVELTKKELFGYETLILPGVSAFIGADIIAGILFCGGHSIQGKNLLIDLGTNGEMALFGGSFEEILVASTAAGSAFEGGNISMGMASVPGAIAKVNFSPETCVFNYETVGGKPPIGICGSGVVDVCACLIRHGLVDKAGHLLSGDDSVTIANILFTQKDIREVQLAKSAIRAGIETLLDEVGLAYDNIQRVFLAGGFGYKIDIESAATLGLLPAQLKGKVQAVGNSSLGGCAKVLQNPTLEAAASKLAASAKEISLSDHPNFSELFMKHISMG